MYCTVGDFIAIFGESHALAVSNVESPDAIEVNEAVLGQALFEAEGEVNAYLTAYDLPLSPFPLVLRGCVADIANYRLHKTLVPEDVRQRYEDRIRFLERVAAGLIQLQVPPSQTNYRAAIARAPGRTFFRADTVRYYRTGQP